MYKLYNGDCLEVMDRLISEGVKIDLILCDPPYGNMKNAKLDGWKNSTTEWDVSIPPHEIFNRVEKLLRENGTLILFSQEPYTSKLRTNTIQNLPFCYPMIWEKDHFANALISKKAPVSYFEDINVFTKKYDTEMTHPLRKYSKQVNEYIGMSLKDINRALGHRKAEHFFYWNSTQFKIPTRNTYDELINVFKINNMDGFISYNDMININKKYSKVFNLYGDSKKSNILKYKKDYGKFHPTQKPIKLLIDILKTYSNKNDLVLDFTMGSGSTGVACMNTDRKFIGIELDENYFNIAKQRIEEALK